MPYRARVSSTLYRGGVVHSPADPFAEALLVEDGTEVLVSERPQGTFSRQLFLGDNLDTDKIEASYDNGVLTVKLPVAVWV